MKYENVIKIDSLNKEIDKLQDINIDLKVSVN